MLSAPTSLSRIQNSCPARGKITVGRRLAPAAINKKQTPTGNPRLLLVGVFVCAGVFAVCQAQNVVAAHVVVTAQGDQVLNGQPPLAVLVHTVGLAGDLQHGGNIRLL